MLGVAFRLYLDRESARMCVDSLRPETGPEYLYLVWNLWNCVLCVFCCGDAIVAVVVSGCADEVKSSSLFDIPSHDRPMGCPMCEELCEVCVCEGQAVLVYWSTSSTTRSP